VRNDIKKAGYATTCVGGWRPATSGAECRDTVLETEREPTDCYLAPSRDRLLAADL